MATLGRIDLQEPETLDGGSGHLRVLPAAMDYMQSRGLVTMKDPNDDYKGEMPEDLSALDDEQLGDLLNSLARWCSYVEAELSKASTAMEEAKEILEFTKARVRISIRAGIDDYGKLTVSDKNDYMTTHPKVVEAQAAYLYHSSIYTMTRAVLNQAQRNWETASRRITQRGQEIERMKREGNVAGVPLQSRTFTRRGM